MIPADDADLAGVHVLKGGRRLGPFTLDQLLDGLESGDFSEEDVCLREGATECERLRDLLDWEEDPVLEDAEEFDSEDAEGDFDEDFPASSSGLATGARASGPTAVPPLPVSSTPVDRILYSGHPSVLNHPFALLFLVGGLVGGIWLLRVDSVFLLLGIALATAGLVRLSWIRFSNEYRVRSRRVEVITGFLARSSREVRIADIRSVNVTCLGLRGILGIGTVDFLTSGDQPEVSFRRIWAARRIKILVRRLQDAG